MIESMRMRWIIIFIVLAFGILWNVPNFSGIKREDWFTNGKLVFGLDIQGGTQLVLGVDMEAAIKEKMARSARGFRDDLTEEKFAIASVEVSPTEPTELSIKVKASSDMAGIRKRLEDYYGEDWQTVSEEGESLTIRYLDARVQELKTQILNQSIEVIRNRVDAFGVAEPSISAQGDDRILVQLPGIKDAAQAKSLINQTARLEYLVVAQPKEEFDLGAAIAEAETAGNYRLAKESLSYGAYVKRVNADLQGKLPPGTKVVFQQNENTANMETAPQPILLKVQPSVSGAELEDARVGQDEYGLPNVVFRFSIEGRRRFAQLTEDAVGGAIAIVLDDRVVSVASVKEKIDSPQATITFGRRDYQSAYNEARFIATTLRAGSLPAALTQLEERTVGPTLGADAIQKGQMATMVGGVLVLLFMLFYYRTLGVVADLSLVLNVILLLALLTALDATLTLPGVAGIALTIGMAVDANVIIFERMKEELSRGASVRGAIRDGFGNAFSAIFDSNITTVLTCVVLIYFGTGPVRGFAVTLICGILTSMFTAIFVSRTLLDFLVHRLKLQRI